MDRYDYAEAVKNDVKEYINENVDLQEYAGNRDGMIEELQDSLFVEDSVTGNASGSYYCNAWKAEEAICHNLDLLVEACHEFGEENMGKYLENPESADVTIRCYVLSQAIEEAVAEIEQEKGIDLEDENAFDKSEQERD